MTPRSSRTPLEPPKDLRILELAADHIRRFGPERTSVTGIAAAAGMSHANVYRYYPSKRALFDEVTATWLKTLEAELHVIADAPDPAFDKLERMILAIHRTYRQKLETDPTIFRLLLAAADKRALVARRHRARIETEIHHVLEEAGGLAETCDMGNFLKLVLDTLNRFIDPAAVARDINEPRVELEARAARIMDLLRLMLGRIE